MAKSTFGLVVDGRCSAVMAVIADRQSFQIPRCSKSFASVANLPWESELIVIVQYMSIRESKQTIVSKSQHVKSPEKMFGSDIKR